MNYNKLIFDEIDSIISQSIGLMDKSIEYKILSFTEYVWDLDYPVKVIRVNEYDFYIKESKVRKILAFLNRVVIRDCASWL